MTILLDDRGILEERSDQYLAPRYQNFRGRTARKLEDCNKPFAEALKVVMRIWSRVEDDVKKWILGQPN